MRIYLFQRWLQIHLCGEYFLCSSQISEGSPWSWMPENPPWHSGTESNKVSWFSSATAITVKSCFSWRENTNIALNSSYADINYWAVINVWEGRSCWDKMDKDAIPFPTTRCQAYIVVAERGGLLNVKSVDILLEQTKQRKVEGGKSGLLALKWHSRWSWVM